MSHVLAASSLIVKYRQFYRPSPTLELYPDDAIRAEIDVNPDEVEKVKKRNPERLDYKY